LWGVMARDGGVGVVWIREDGETAGDGLREGWEVRTDLRWEMR